MSLHVIADRYIVSAQEDRSAPRSKAKISAQFRTSGARGLHIEVVDLSLSGFAATSPSRIHVGTICWLTLPGLESLQAEVVWWQDGLCGCAFAKLLSPLVLDNILAGYRTYDEAQP